MSSDYRTYVTQTGFGLEAQAKQAGTGVFDGSVWFVIGDKLLGDADNPASQDNLLNQVRSYGATIEPDETDPTIWVARVEIPANDGGFFIREAGIRVGDSDTGYLYCYARQGGDYKPNLEEGQGKSYTIRLKFIPGNASVINAKIDPSVQFATPTDLSNAISDHKNESNPHQQYPLAVNTVSGQNSTRTTQINETAAQGALVSGFWTVYTNNNLNYYPSSKLQYPIHMIKAAYSVVGNKGGLEILGGDSRTSPLFFRVSTGIGAGTLQQLYSDINPPSVGNVTGAQYAPYSPTRVYKCGEVCTTEVDGIVQFWEWYSNVESLAGKDPSQTANRQDGWEDDTKPYYWMPHKKARAGTPLFPWLSETVPEGTLNVVGNSVPVAVFWRLAAAFPEFVNADTGMIDFPDTRGEFFRVLDQGRGIDVDRGFGSSQEQSLEHHDIQLLGKGANDSISIGNVVHLGRRGAGSDPVGILGYSGQSPLPNTYYDSWDGTPYGMYSDGDDETRPRNLAFPILVEV